MQIARLARLFVLPAALALPTLAAHADTFDWSYSDSTLTGSGTLTATDTNGKWTITGITGTFDGSAITGLISFYNSDNVLYTTGNINLDNRGLSFETANDAEISIWGLGTAGSTNSNPSGDNYGIEATRPDDDLNEGNFYLTPVAATPEPSSLVLLGSGLLGAAGVARRRFGR